MSKGEGNQESTFFKFVLNKHLAEKDKEIEKLKQELKKAEEKQGFCYACGKEIQK